jgi:[acyl-carrier-protein] S-malonyltransferase
MTAIIGGDRDEVLATLKRHGLTAANDNGPGQIVAAGTLLELDQLAKDPPSRARLIPLSVAGAFHTHHMQPAVGRLAALARSVSTHDPRSRMLSNRDGQVVHDGAEVLSRLVTQVGSPVRWDLCMQTMTDLGVTGMLEMPPAGTLTGIAKRQLTGVETFALKTPDQLDDAIAFVDKHGDVSSLSTSPTWRLLVAPSKGTFHQAVDIPIGTSLDAGAVIGAVHGRRDEVAVVAPHGGSIVEWVVEDGDLVSPGQALVRLHPESDEL